MGNLFELSRLLYPKKEAAYLLAMSVRSLDYHIHNKEINVRRRGKSVLVPRSEILKFARADHGGRPPTAKERASKNGNQGSEPGGGLDD